MEQDENILKVCSYDLLIHISCLFCIVYVWLHLDISTFVLDHRSFTSFWGVLAHFYIIYYWSIWAFECVMDLQIFEYVVNLWSVNIEMCCETCNVLFSWPRIELLWKHYLIHMLLIFIWFMGRLWLQLISHYHPSFPW
jgi:hypothetical protein